MPQNLTVTALAMWGLFALGVIVGACYCYYSDNHIDEKLGVSKGKVKLSAAIISGVFLSLLSIKVAKNAAAAASSIPGISIFATLIDSRDKKTPLIIAALSLTFPLLTPSLSSM